MIIGFGYKKFAGKDTAADYLRTNYGFKKRAFADALKLEVQQTWKKTILSWWSSLDPISGEVNVPLSIWTRYAHEKEIDYKDEDKLIHWLVWVLKPPFIVSLLQEYGTALRRREEPDYWIREWLRWYDEETRHEGRYYKGNFVIPDVRFENEAEWIKNIGGIVIEISRDVDRSQYGTHSSEEEGKKIRWNRIIHNNGTIEELYSQLDTIMLEKGINRHGSK